MPESKGSKGKFYSSIRKAFEAGKENPYADLIELFKQEKWKQGLELWKRSLEAQARGEIVNRYEGTPQDKKIKG